MYIIVDFASYTLFLCNAIIYLVILNFDLELDLPAEDTDYFENMTELAHLHDIYVNTIALTLFLAVA